MTLRPRFKFFFILGEVALLGVMNRTHSFSQAARKAFDNLSLELQKSANDDNFIEELEEFLKIRNKYGID